MDNQSQVISLRNIEVIDSEAADWLAKLDGGTLSSADRRALKKWLSSDPRHAVALKGLAAIWGDMDILLNDYPDLKDINTVKMFPFFTAYKWVLPTLSVCFIAMFVWMMVVPVNQSVKAERSFYTTNIGKQKIEHFSDGSTAHLNTGSIVETEFTDSERIVRLIRGEALFEVAHNPARPFIVYVGNQKIRAIGTAFVVRLSSENILVTVTDGKVQLSKRVKDDTVISDASDLTQEQEVVVISKGEAVEVNDNTVKAKSEDVESEEMNRRLSWLKGNLVFKNERLEQVIKEISRYVPVRIVIDDPELRDIKISGRFEIGDTDALLEAIEVSLNLNASKVDEKVIHLSRSTELP